MLTYSIAQYTEEVPGKVMYDPPHPPLGGHVMSSERTQRWVTRSGVCGAFIGVYNGNEASQDHRREIWDSIKVGESTGHNGGRTAGSQDSNKQRSSPERKYGTANRESRGSKANSGDGPG